MPIVHSAKDSKSGAPAAAAAAAGAGAGRGGGAAAAAAAPVFQPGETLPIPAGTTLVLGLGWDLARKGAVDLDASCVCFDNNGQYLSSVYFGNLVNENRSIVHSGDNRDGAGEGDDERITVKINQLPDNVRALVFSVSSYNGDHFYCVQSAGVRLMDGSHAKPGSAMPEFGRFQLEAEGSHTAMLLCALYRGARGTAAAGQWLFQAIGRATEGRSFGDLLPHMQTELVPLLLPTVVHVNPTPNVIVLTKGESVALHDRDGTPLDSVMIGLGWDQTGGKAIDLDSSIVLFDEKHALLEAVFFNNLKNSNGSVRHGGDNRTGEGEGDDEKIFIDLKKLPARCHYAYIVVNSYSGEPFSTIANAYCRVVSQPTTRNAAELIRFELSSLGRNNTALLMCKLSLVKAHDQKDAKAADTDSDVQPQWMLKALGHGAFGSMYKDNIADMQRDMKGLLRASTDGFRFTPLPHRHGAAGAAAGAGAGAGAVTAGAGAGKSNSQLLVLVIAIAVLALLWQVFFAADEVPQNLHSKSHSRARR